MTENQNTFRLPMLALRGLTVFPGMLLTFDVERPASIAALEAAAQEQQLIFLASQKSLKADLPKEDELHHIGTVCRIRQKLRQPQDGLCRVMVEGLYRAEALSIDTEKTSFFAELIQLPDKPERMNGERLEALQRRCTSTF